MPQNLTCEIGNHHFELSNADISAYKKFGSEPLPICFQHQHQWRLAFRNDRFLHRRKCDLTGAEIISMYPADSPYKVYEREAWYSDKWDPLEYGREFDFNRPFFEQYAELQREVPRMALVNIGSVNSDFCNSCVYNKNCYLIFGGDRNEDSMYGALPMFCRDCTDCDWTTNCELCYFCAYLDKCYGCRFAFNSKDCSDCAFVEDCIGCTECILSFNLRNKSYVIENKQYSKEEYFEKKHALLDDNYSTQQKLWKKFLDLRSRRDVKYGHIINGENVSGDIIFNSKNCANCFECFGSEDCRECWTILDSKDCFNGNYIGHGSELNFNNLSTDGATNTQFSYFTISSSNVMYSEAIISSHDIFGSIGLRHQEYCILNKTYERSEYEKLIKKIIEHMKKTGEFGRFFPKNLSTFPYNESTASYFFPRTRTEAIKEGFRWKEETNTPQSQTYIIPDNIRDVKDNILEAALACESYDILEVTLLDERGSGFASPSDAKEGGRVRAQRGELVGETLVSPKIIKNFKIIPQELSFYRKQGIPIPRRHPDTRYSDRLALRNPFRLWNRACQSCSATLQTTYAPERLEKVLCEKCYQLICS